MRENAKSIDLSSILSPALEEQVKNAAEISMGTEIAEDDITHIVQMCDEVIFYFICILSFFIYFYNVVCTTLVIYMKQDIFKINIYYVGLIKMYIFFFIFAIDIRYFYLSSNTI